MFFISKFLKAFLLPPGCFILFLLIIAILGRRLCRGLSLSIYIAAALLYIISSAAGVFLLVNPLEAAYPKWDGRKEGAEAVVILGGGMNKAPDSYYLGSSSAIRTLEGLSVAKSTGLPVIVSGGDTYGNMGKGSGELMMETLVELGMPAKRVIVEGESRNTEENSVYTAEICRQKGYKKVILVTSALHMRRSVLLFSEEDLEIIPCPTDYEGLYRKTAFFDYLPSGVFFDSVIKALHEYLGFFWYRLRGGFKGKESLSFGNTGPCSSSRYRVVCFNSIDYRLPHREEPI